MQPSVALSQSLALDKHLQAHAWHAKSALLFEESLKNEAGCPWQMDLYKRQFLARLSRLEQLGLIDELRALTWSRDQRRKRRKLIKSANRRQRSQLSTALEIWCHEQSATHYSSIMAGRYFSALLEYGN